MCIVGLVRAAAQGDTHTTDDADLSLETLAADMTDLVKTLYGAAMPDLFLAGHRSVSTRAVGPVSDTAD